ncbi:MAG: thiamine phosphate synthase [Rhodothermales bacterium]
MDLPRLMLIADGFTRDDVYAKVRSAAEFGVPWIQLRDHSARTDVFEHAAGRLVAELQRINPRLLISINSRIAVCESMGLPLHTGFHGVSVSEGVNILGYDALVGASVHSRFEAVDASRDGAKYVIFSPVYESPTHPGKKGWGLELLRTVCSSVPDIPVMAMGGIMPEHVTGCLTAGAHGVATHFGIMGAMNIREAVSEYLRVVPR